jgi:hypothetical protein
MRTAARIIKASNNYLVLIQPTIVHEFYYPRMCLPIDVSGENTFLMYDFELFDIIIYNTSLIGNLSHKYVMYIIQSCTITITLHRIVFMCMK